MVITEILVKLDEGQIPESLLKTIKQTQQQYLILMAIGMTWQS